MRYNDVRIGLSLTLSWLAVAASAADAIMDPLKEPDYTQGETVGERYAGKGSWNYASLGSLGAIANVWGTGAEESTTETRMLQIRSVMKGAPAEGLLNEGDVILGVIGPAPVGQAGKDGRFDSDARKAISAAITEAEKRENAGQIVLNVWRIATKSSEPVTVTVPVMGTSSETSPWDCEKTKVIIDAACKSILDRGLYDVKRDGARTIKGGIPTRLEVLGLLATGEEKYLPVVQSYVRELGDPSKEMSEEFSSWSISYETLLLAEYYLATQDEYVLPAINKLARRIARGASDVGTFGHGSACSFMANGKRWKYPSGYGAMNQCSITCALSLVLARKCGVRDDEVDDVVRKALNFYRWYVDKGAIPYGDHEPGHGHDNNGVNSQAAVLFDLAGDKEATEYFTRTTLASYHIREKGHTGHFFSFQWGALGAARGGEQAAQSFTKNVRWLTELERRPDGSFMYQPQLANADHGKYLNWSTTGSRLLQYCLPRKKLYITGKGGACIEPITGDDLKTVVAAGEFDAKTLTVRELLDALGSWSPVVRRKAAEELGERDDNVVKEMIAMLDSPNRYARYGATEGLSYAGRGSEEAIDALLKKLQDSDDLTLCFFAIAALREKRIWQGPPIRAWKSLPNTLAKEGGAIDKAVPVLLEQATAVEPSKDPMRKLQAVISSTLFYGGNVSDYTGFFPNGKGVEKLDRTLLIPAVKSLLLNPNGGARSTVSAVYSNLTEDDLKQLWGDIYYATKYQAPSGVMFAGGVRARGLELMAKKGVQEGISLGIDWALRQEGWGNGGRKKDGIPSLLKYGKALEAYVPEIDAVLAGWSKEKNSKNDQVVADDFRKRLAEAMVQPAPNLFSIKPYIDTTPDPLAPTEQR